MCPRFGDAYNRTEKADNIKSDVANYRIQKVAQKNIDTLDLSGCSFAFLPDELRQLPAVVNNLVDLNLARNQLFNTDAVFMVLKSLKNLKRLSLANNFLNGKLSEDAGYLSNLEELDLDGNQLTALNNSCGNWSGMRVFTANSNMLTAVPVAAEHWTSLEMLSLRDNKIAELPPGSDKWLGMKRLMIGGNKFTALPPAVPLMLELRELDVRKVRAARAERAARERSDAGCEGLYAGGGEGAPSTPRRPQGG
jgi:Leucine-rich repeat (LRR) protein